MLDATTIILAEDGRHVTLGRYREPDATEVETSADGLTSQGLGGWLCRLEGKYYGRATLSLMQMRILGKPTARFDQAVTRFLNLRQDRLS